MTTTEAEAQIARIIAASQDPEVLRAEQILREALALPGSDPIHRVAVEQASAAHKSALEAALAKEV
jgi:hypothetical protein